MTWDLVMLPCILFFALNFLGGVDAAKHRHSSERLVKSVSAASQVRLQSQCRE